MDRHNPTNGEVTPGISIRNGPVLDQNDIPMKDLPTTVNGTAAKRKTRESMDKPSYAEAESSDDDVPLVNSSRPVSFI